MLGHTRCGAVAAAIKGMKEGFIKYITDDIRETIGVETDDYKALYKCGHRQGGLDIAVGKV